MVWICLTLLSTDMFGSLQNNIGSMVCICLALPKGDLFGSMQGQSKKHKCGVEEAKIEHW
jgi:hypothetical protein